MMKRPEDHYFFAELDNLERNISSGVQEALEYALEGVVDKACSDKYGTLTSREIVDAILRGIDDFANRKRKAVLRGKVKRTRVENGIE